MKTARLMLLVFSCLLVGCGSTPKLVNPPLSTLRNYNGTAAVGDFLTISIDSGAQTIAYKNYTNGETGTVPYSVDADGSYTIADPQGNLLSAYEVPGSMLVVEAAAREALTKDGYRFATSNRQVSTARNRCNAESAKQPNLRHAA